MSAEMQINYDNKCQPNPVLKDCFNEANDIWALGMIGYQLLCLKKPFNRVSFEFDEDNQAWRKLSTEGKAWFAQIFPKNYFNAHSRQCQINRINREEIAQIIESWFGEEAASILPEGYLPEASDQQDPYFMRPQYQKVLKNWPSQEYEMLDIFKKDHYNS